MKKRYVFSFFSPALILAVLLFLVISSRLSWAVGTKYISGVIVVNIRDTDSKNYKKIGSVDTGAQVEVIEVQGHFAKVKTKDNIVGWVPLQYLSNDPPAVATIARLKDELAAAKNENAEQSSNDSSSVDKSIADEQKQSYEKQIESLKSQNSRLLQDNQKLIKMIQEKNESAKTVAGGNKKTVDLKQQVASLQKQLETLRKNSKNIIQITDERDRLTREASSLQSDLVSSRERNKKLEKEYRLHWFLAGAAVFFLGFLSSKLFFRRKSKLSF